MIERIKSFLSDFFEYVGRNFKELLVYSVIAAFFFLFSLYLMFPYENIASGLIKRIEKQYFVKLKIGSIAPRLPIGLTCERVEISGRKLTNNIPIKLDRLKINIEVASILSYPFTRALTYDFGAVINKGTADGTLRMGKNSIDFGLETEAFNLEAISPLLAGNGLLLGGISDSNIILSSESKNAQPPGLMDARGEISIKISDLSLAALLDKNDSSQSFESLTPIMKSLIYQPLSFTKIESKAVIQDGIVRISDMNLARQGFEGRVSGTVKLESNLMDSYLDVALNLKFDENETLFKPMLSKLDPAFGCPLNPDNSMACKIKHTIQELNALVPPF